MSKEWYYRLGNHDDNDGFLWSGRIKSEEDLTEAQAREMVRRREHLTKLPSRTIVLSAENLTGNKKS
jgi:hypothetical protein